MQIVPVNASPSQTFDLNLNGQSCTINLYWLGLSEPFLYLDLYVDSVLIIGGVMCLNAKLIVRDAYLGFVGDLAFFDLQGSTNPTYDALGSRYILIYLQPGDS